MPLRPHRDTGALPPLLLNLYVEEALEEEKIHFAAIAQ
jgi:hypothetical protein